MPRQEWKNIQQKDNKNFLTNYGRDYPEREDLAETFPLYLGLKFRACQVSSEFKKNLLKLIPNRIRYFEKQNFAVLKNRAVAA